MVIPYYNKEEFIERALSSVILQAYRFDEILIINDGSSLRSLKKLKVIVSSLNYNIKIINIKNRGVSYARNLGFEQSRNNFVCFLDADDELLPGYLKTLNDFISCNPRKALYGLGYFEYDKPVSKNLLIAQDDYFSLYNGVMKPPFCASSVCINRFYFDDKEVFPVGYKMGEDLFAWVCICLNKPFYYNSTPLVIYHHDDVDSAVIKIAPKDLPPLLVNPNVSFDTKAAKIFIYNQKLIYLKLQFLYGSKFNVLKMLSKNFEFRFIPILLLLLIPKRFILGVWLEIKKYNRV
jgi:glycosyltransferase involved in cell wall biosynthesis